MPKYTVQFSKQTDRDLERLTKDLGVNSKAEVVRKAVNLCSRNRREGAGSSSRTGGIK